MIAQKYLCKYEDNYFILQNKHLCIYEDSFGAKVLKMIVPLDKGTNIMASSLHNTFQFFQHYFYRFSTLWYSQQYYSRKVENQAQDKNLTRVKAENHFRRLLHFRHAQPLWDPKQKKGILAAAQSRSNKLYMYPKTKKWATYTQLYFK